MRNGQITLFVVVGFIVIFIVAFFFIFLESRIGSFNLYESVQLEKYVEDCGEKVLRIGLDILGTRGGFIYDFEPKLNTSNIPVAIHMMNDHFTSPDISFIKNEIKYFTEEEMKKCILEFASSTEDLEVEEIEILNNTISMSIGLFAEKGNQEVYESYVSINHPLGEMLKKKDDLLEDYENLNTADFEDYYLVGGAFDSEKIVYSLISYDDGYSLNFASMVRGNLPPRLDFIPDFVISTNEVFTYQLSASDPDGDELDFFTDNALVGLTSDGLLTFEPVVKGNYTIEVCVRDEMFAQDCADIKFMIKDE